MHRELVDRRRWIGDDRFLHALNYCMLLPGPEAQQLAIYIGWLLHGVRGGLVAGVLFVLPAAVILWLLSYVYVIHGHVAWVAAAFAGLQPAVLAVVTMAVLRVGRRALRSWLAWVVAAGSFAALTFAHVPFPLVILSAMLVGCVWRGQWTRTAPASHTDGVARADDDGGAMHVHVKPTMARTLRVVAVGMLLWWGPLALLWGSLGRDHVLTQEGLFFSKAAMVTFGGAYAVLPYVSQQAVERYAWLDASQMLDGLGLAETTPGPLVMVLQFVGFLGAYHHPHPFTPLVAATLGALVTTWSTFVPCFLWIFLGAPYVERLRGNRAMQAALSAVTAAVVGVILSLAVWFGAHVLWSRHDGVNGFGLGVVLVALVGMQRWQWGMIPVILGAAAVGVVHSWL